MNGKQFPVSEHHHNALWFTSDPVLFHSIQCRVILHPSEQLKLKFQNRFFGQFMKKHKEALEKFHEKNSDVMAGFF